jgi:DNA-nicking Smr family endonuclease
MMGTKKKKGGHSLHRSKFRKSTVQGFYTPFEDLDQHLEKNSPKVVRIQKTPPPAPRPVQDRPDDEERLFAEAMKGVVPLKKSKADRVSPVPSGRKSPRFLVQEELEAYSQLMDLVAGDGEFELSYSDEYVEGAVVGISPQVIKKLRNGELSYQDYVDLHGFKRDEAREVVTRFVRQSFAGKLRCVLIVSGRGLNSKDKEPVLKQGLVRWLTRAPLKRLVLAFASARPYDGGAGAFYVLLRRNQGKDRFVSPAV